MAATMATKLNSTSSLSGEECFNIIKLRLQTTKFRILKTEVKPFTETPSGFLGDHYRLTVTVEMLDQTIESNGPLNIQFFVKCMPIMKNKELNFVSTMGAFRKEYGILKCLIKDLMVSQQQSNYGGSSTSPSWTCECFLARPDAIVLEDLTVDGYRCVDSWSTLDYTHSVLALETLARFHASSIIFEERANCRIDEKYQDLFFETIFVEEDDHPGMKICLTGIKSMKALLKYMPRYDENSQHHEFIKRRLEEIGMQTFAFAKPSAKHRNVMSHGDLWSNNLLFRYDAAGEPVDCRLVDLQLVRYTPPANDVMCLLMLTTSRELRDSRLEDLLAAYHRGLEQELNLYGFKIGSLFPWEEFRDSCNSHHVLGRIMACYYFQLVILKPDKIANLFRSPEAFSRFLLVDRVAETVDNFLSDSTFRERISSVMEELIETCILRGE